MFCPKRGPGPHSGFIALLFLFLAASNLFAQPDRIASSIDLSRTVVLSGNRHWQAQPQYDLGPADPALEIPYVTLLLKPSPVQQSALDRLLDDLQSPASPDFHKFLTPEQFADRFGLSRNDLAKVTRWLESSGLHVNDVARGRHWITLSGPAARVGSAFRTEIHRYRLDGKLRRANATEPSVPAALAGIVAAIQGLDDFPLESYHISQPADDPRFNNGGTHSMAPDDFATIYHVDALYQQGIDGTGMKIAVAGQTDITVADVHTFRARYNLPPNDPQVMLVGPDPGVSQTDQGEAYLDVEWAGAVARNATVIYVNSLNVSTSAQYAIDQNLAPVLSFSYGSCEEKTSPAFRAVAQQAAAQGITWLVAAGDSGANSCDPHAAAVQSTKGRAVAFPASAPEVTAVGGTMFNEGGGNYWLATNGPNSNSAVSYIPEQVWNETDAALPGLNSGGGGASIFFSKPVWQAGPGVPDDNARDLPDVALAAAIHDGYRTFHNNTNFLDAGTSAAAPPFAGIVVLLNQYLVAQKSISKPGLGSINPALYRMAQRTTDVFHDITTGDNINPCSLYSPNCVNGLSGFDAGPNYDLASGLGSVDAYNLVTEWNKSTGSASTTRLTTDVSSTDLNGVVNLTASVSGTGGTPSGTVTFTVGNNDSALGSATISSGIATLTVPANLLPVGSDTLWAEYSGDGAFNASSGSAPVSVTVPPSGAVVVATISPNPIFQSPANADGFSWFFRISLKELAGVPATLTHFTINGKDQTLSNFFTSTSIAAKGTLTSNVEFSGPTPPVTLPFGFSGVDAVNRTWSQQVPVTFQGPGVVTPSMLLLAPTGPVQQNPAADPSCQWAQPVYLQEQGGYLVSLTRLTAGTKDMSDSLQPIFGTTRLAPFGTLQGTLCTAGANTPPNTTYTIAGAPDGTGSVSTTLSTTFGAAAASPSKSSVSPEIVTMQVSSAQTATAAVSLTTSSTQWTVTVLPAGRTTSWLQVSPSSGSGSATINLKATATGLSNGVYNAILAISAPGSVPQFLNVTVVLEVGSAPGMSIGGVSNVFSGQPGFAPGMLLAVYGTQLAAPTQVAQALPLPLSMGTISATINGISAPLFFISPGQFDIQIPYETGAGTAVLGINNGGKVTSFTFPVTMTSPGLWPHFLNLSNQLVTTAKAGDILVTFMTGEGDVDPPLADGAAPPVTTSAKNLPTPLLPVTVTVGGVPANVLFAGITSSAAGVSQIDFTVPKVAAGAQPVVVTVGGVSSTPLTLTIQ